MVGPGFGLDSFSRLEHSELDVDSIEKNLEYGISKDALRGLTERMMEKLEVALARAYVTGAVAVDVTWYKIHTDTGKVFEVKRWHEDPPAEPESYPDKWLDIDRVERYDLTQTDEEEFVEAMEQSSVDFSDIVANMEKK